MKASVYDDFIGRTFGRLKVVERIEDKIEGKYGRPQFLCKCECGNTKKVLGKYLKSGHVQSCGCMHRDSLIDRNKSNSKNNIYDMSNDEYGVVWNAEHTVNFKFDKEDYELIKDIYWNDHKGYAYGGNSNVSMHRLIMGAKDPNYDVDHINHDTRDNRKCNLRIVTHQQNQFNSKTRTDNTSGFTGVYFISGKWVARIYYCGNSIHLGSFANKDDAIRSRLNAENEFFGEYSYINSLKMSMR